MEIMKTLLYIIPAMLFLTLAQTSCSKDDEDATPNPTVNAPATELNEAEVSALIYMREEEKLARDVYLFSLDLYGMRIFSNISESEQVHMDAILDLMNTYNIQDKTPQETGVFNNSELQKLYNDLTARSSKSLLDALMVGATIEDLDIKDLKEQAQKTERADIIGTFGFLECGSRNHMRSYDMQVENSGGSYTAQFISQEEYDAIVDSEKEMCAW